MATTEKVCSALFTKKGYEIFQCMTMEDQIKVLRAFDETMERGNWDYR